VRPRNANAGPARHVREPAAHVKYVSYVATARVVNGALNVRGDLVRLAARVEGKWTIPAARVYGRDRV